MIQAFALAVTLLSGTITYYAEGVMERVQAYRGLSCAECIGAVALLPAEDIGRRVWLQRAGEAAEGPFLVVDCAQAEHREALEARGIVGEVDWPTARRWGMAGPMAGVSVWYWDVGKLGDWEIGTLVERYTGRAVNRFTNLPIYPSTRQEVR